MKNIILSLICLFPSVSLAEFSQAQRKYELQEQVRIAKATVENSPYIGMAAYGFGALAVFVGLIVLVFVLIMFLRR